MGDTVDEISGLAGGGGPNNSRFTASNTNILQPTTVGQANTAYQSAQDALAQQQALAQALQAQGSQGMASQTQLAQALQQQAQGGGPNPALAQLNQSTANNTANQAALMAGQRGASANAGLIARQAAQTGAANQQNAAGQAATLQAQQQLAAQQQLQNLAANQIGQQSGAINTYNQAAQGEQGNILNSINAQNNAMVGMQSNINNANAGIAQTNANNSAKFTSGLLNSVGGAIAGPGGGGGGGFAHGGMVEDPLPNKKLAKVPVKDRMPLPDHIQGMADIYHPHYAFGGPVVASGPANDVGSPNAIANASQIGSGGGSKKSPTKDTPISTSENDVVGSSGASGGANLAGGAMDAGGGGLMGAVEANPALLLAASKGAFVPGKAKVKGDSPKNDTVDAKLSPGEIVIPRHILQSDDPVANSANFVKALLEKHGHMGKEEDDFKAALKTAIKSRGKK